ncbi:MAG: OmpA family protein [Paracoccus sp. (in: a-proteobacteria)]|uniref:OmpA family protein n=1 Tax=Paracoccus sp. TaxID=267 RepID=UPI003241DD23
MASPRRRFSTTLATVLVMGGAGGLCWVGAEAAATFIEERAAQDVGLALQSGGFDWATVSTDGLRVRLTGTAPTEVERFRAMTQATGVVDANRIVDEMTVASVEAMTPPDFKIELLRNDQGVSLIGLVPAATDRQAILRSLRADAPDGQVTDLLESADYQVPDLWDASVTYGIKAAQMTDQAKVSIGPGLVVVAALAKDREDKGRLEAALKRDLPKGVRLDSSITAPRPVIAPFTMRFAIDDKGPRFDACAADDEAAQDRIIGAARTVGLEGAVDCTLGLGAPSPDWGSAAEAAIKAVGQLGAGQVTISDADVALVVPAGMDQGRFDAAAGELEQALPQGFSLKAVLEKARPKDQGPATFEATLTESGSLSMTGRIADQQMREAVDSFATSRFDVTQSGLRSDPDVPGGWTVRVVAALEAIDALQAGSVRVTPDLLQVTGMSGDPNATDRTAALLSQRLGTGARYALTIGYDRRLDPALGLPDGDECVAQLNTVMSESEIGFEPSSSSIAGDPGPTLDRLAQTMVECADFQIEAGGHTDAQGSDGFNAELSRGRAQAIVTAMKDAGIDITNMTSRGYGESQPIATNDTEEGREANRRIEFRLLSPHPARAAAPAVTAVTGITGQQAEQPEAPPVQGPNLPQMQGPNLPPRPAQMQGPNLPRSNDGSSMTPLTIGVSEEFESLDAREENLRVPVQTPDADTPRPGPRPDDVAERAATQEAATQEDEAKTP